MKNFTELLRNRLDIALNKITNSSSNAVERAICSLQIVESVLWELKEFICSYHFVEVEEEIRFFREIKTSFSREQIFYDRLLFIESNRPYDNRAGQKKYLQQMLNGIDLYFRSNQAFYSYYKMNRKDMDEQIFVRNAQPVPSLIASARPDLDTRFGNPYSLKLAKIQAYEQVAGYMTDLLDYLKPGSKLPDSNLFWSGTDSQFIELMLALHSRGAINNGDLNFSQLAEKFGNRLSIKTRNIHQVVKNIRSRKKDRTVFLKQLIESAERKMDETDQDI